MFQPHPRFFVANPTASVQVGLDFPLVRSSWQIVSKLRHHVFNTKYRKLIYVKIKQNLSQSSSLLRIVSATMAFHYVSLIAAVSLSKQTPAIWIWKFRAQVAQHIPWCLFLGFATLAPNQCSPQRSVGKCFAGPMDLFDVQLSTLQIRTDELRLIYNTMRR